MARHRKGRPSPAADTRLPAAFVARTEALLGSEWPALQEALDAPAPVSIRLNAAKPGGPEGEVVPWCGTGRYLSERPRFTLDPLLHAGAYYVQEASSMLLEQALRASGLLDQPILALDLCAAPGGKSTLVRSLLHPGSLLVANEVERRRQQALQENLWKWGLPNVVVTGSDPAALQALPESFDLIVVDAPCSGEGMFRKDPFARQQWTEQLVVQCAGIQERIVEQAWNALRPGGVLIYSTCTWESSENEQRVAELAHRGAQPLPLAMDPAWGVVAVPVEGITAYRCYPHRVRGEGFFLAAVRKPGDARVTPRVPAAGSGDPALRNWLVDADLWWLTGQDGTVYAVDARWQGVLRELQQALRVVAPGRPLAVEHAGTWRPHPALALDTALRRGAFPELELDSATALRYLRGEALPATAAAGQALVVCAGLPLGWVNGAGNRWNNGWPTNWRIRMQAT